RRRSGGKEAPLRGYGGLYRQSTRRARIIKHLPQGIALTPADVPRYIPLGGTGRPTWKETMLERPPLATAQLRTSRPDGRLRFPPARRRQVTLRHSLPRSGSPTLSLPLPNRRRAPARGGFVVSGWIPGRRWAQGRPRLDAISLWTDRPPQP